MSGTNELVEDYISDEWAGLSEDARENLKPGVNWVLHILSKKDIVPRCKDCLYCYGAINRTGLLYCAWNEHDVKPEGYCDDWVDPKEVYS